MRSPLLVSLLQNVPLAVKHSVAVFEYKKLRFMICVAKLNLRTTQLRNRLEGYRIRDIVFFLTCAWVALNAFVIAFITTLNYINR